MRRLPPLTALEAFVQVARTGSVKGAAEELALSTPALSRRIQALERYLGLLVFDRKHQQLELNHDGQRLLAEIAPALDALGAAVETMTGPQRQMRVRLGVLPLFASQRLLPRLGELRAAHPGLHLDIDTSSNATVRLGDGIDAAIVVAKDVDPSFYARELDDDQIFLIASRDRLSGPRAIRDPADIAKETVLIHREMATNFDRWKLAFDLPDMQPAAVDYYDSGPLMLEAAAQGLGIAVMLGRHLEQSHDARLGRLFDYKRVPSPYRYYFVCKHRALDQRPLKIFHDWLIAAEI